MLAAASFCNSRLEENSKLPLLCICMQSHFEGYLYHSGLIFRCLATTWNAVMPQCHKDHVVAAWLAETIIHVVSEHEQLFVATRRLF
jgi:hypothetical protein